MFKFIVLFLLSFSACADEWTQADTTREVVFISVAAVDWLQTRNISRHNCTNPNTGLHNCYESGPAALFIGHNPSVKQVNTLFASAIITHIAIVHFMPSKYRATFQSLSIAVEASYAYRNYQLNISTEF